MDLTQVASFPPFYSRQLHPETLTKQVSLWCDRIMEHCKQQGIYTIDLTEAAIPQIYTNTVIDRTVQKALLNDIYLALLRDGRLQLADALPNRMSIAQLREAPWGMKAIVWWRPVGTWAESVYSFVCGNGMNGQVVTGYELFGPGAPFVLPDQVWTRVIARLEEEGKAALFEGDDARNPLEAGIKFN